MQTTTISVRTNNVLDNKALFMPNGNWVIGEMEDAPKADGFEWGFTALPAVKEGGESFLHILRADLDAGRSKRAGSRKRIYRLPVL